MKPPNITPRLKAIRDERIVYLKVKVKKDTFSLDAYFNCASFLKAMTTLNKLWATKFHIFAVVSIAISTHFTDRIYQLLIDMFVSIKIITNIDVFNI